MFKLLNWFFFLDFSTKKRFFTLRHKKMEMIRFLQPKIYCWLHYKQDFVVFHFWWTFGLCEFDILTKNAHQSYRSFMIAAINNSQTKKYVQYVRTVVLSLVDRWNSSFFLFALVSLLLVAELLRTAFAFQHEIISNWTNS